MNNAFSKIILITTMTLAPFVSRAGEGATMVKCQGSKNINLELVAVGAGDLYLDITSLQSTERFITSMQEGEQQANLTAILEPAQKVIAVAGLRNFSQVLSLYGVPSSFTTKKDVVKFKAQIEVRSDDGKNAKELVTCELKYEI